MRVGDYTLRFYSYLYYFSITKVQRNFGICKFFMLKNVNQQKKSVSSFTDNTD